MIITFTTLSNSQKINQLPSLNMHYDSDMHEGRTGEADVGKVIKPYA